MFDVEYIKVNAATFCSILLIIKINHPIRGIGFDTTYFLCFERSTFPYFIVKNMLVTEIDHTKTNKKCRKLMARY